MAVVPGKAGTCSAGRLRALGAAIACAFASALMLAPGAGAVTFSYTFDGGDQGWRVAQANGGPFAAPDFNLSGGNPGGYISKRDSGSDAGCGTGGTCNLFYFASPGTSTGLAANYGGSVSFDFATNTPPAFSGALYLDSAVDSAPELVRLWQVPGVGFQRVTAPLTEAGWLYCAGNPYTCTPATQAQFQSVLATAAFTDLLADVVNGTGETYSLDNFTVSEKPPPPAKAKKCKKKKGAKGKKRAAAAKKKCGKKRKGGKRSLSVPVAPLNR